jgi:GNAT superfamily N-acetyltransferase
MKRLKLIYKPLTANRWRDFEKLFSEHGVQNGCWCTYWRLSRENFHRHFGNGNKATLKKIVREGKVPGIIAYHKGTPVGWCSIAPREDFTVLDRSPTLKRIDDQPVWSIVCFFVARQYRRMGLSRKLLAAAIDYARKRGARIIEAYPVRGSIKPAAAKWELYTGVASTFARLGFVIASHRSKVRLMMRYYLDR